MFSLLFTCVRHFSIRFSTCIVSASEEYGNRRNRLDWSELDIPKSKFALLKAIKIKHPDVPEPSDIQLHPDGEFDIEITLTLEEEEEILGFQFNEA